MQLIDQHTKKIMEGCKERAWDAGLNFDKETLEYIVTNADMLELSPKNMIPTLYDFWLQDVQVLRGKGEYDAYPHNPYETVINTRPAISFYNDNNPDWLNVMIFYHVIAHIDFFQNNKFFQKTWEYDFKEKALTEKRMIARLRATKGRQVDYVIEFARSLDNLVGYYRDLNDEVNLPETQLSPRADYYFNHFLQDSIKPGNSEFLEEINKYNNALEKSDGENQFFKSVSIKNPEFQSLFDEYRKTKSKSDELDLMQFIMEESPYINKEENKWMKTILSIVRDTSLYFSPQIRTKTMNEGWASYWHEKLFMNDDRIKGNEVAFARVNAKVTSLPKVGLNPYAIGWRLFMFIEEAMDKGKYSTEYFRLFNEEERKDFDKKTDKGRDFIFHIRENYNDFTFLNQFTNQEFVDKHNLMVIGQRINKDKRVKEYYVKSKKAKDYKQMLLDSLYHPPVIKFKANFNGDLDLTHVFEGKELFSDYIANTMIGLEYLWGNRVTLETREVDMEATMRKNRAGDAPYDAVFRKVKYITKNKKVEKINF